MTESQAVPDDVVVASAVDDAVRLSRRPNLAGVCALWTLALRQQVRGWRLIVLALLFLLPSVIALTIHFAAPAAARTVRPGELEFALVYNLIAHALAPLAALLCTAGIVRDEVEEQTLTYLLLRPVRRTAVYAVKLLAAAMVAAVLTASFSVATMLLITALEGRFDLAVLAPRAVRIAVIFGMTQAAYCAVFGLLGLVLRRALIIGIVYIALFEGLLAGFDTLIRRATVMYYFRVLVIRWLEPPSTSAWSIDLKTAAGAQSCAIVLLGAAAVLAALGAILFAAREFRMKTPGAE